MTVHAIEITLTRTIGAAELKAAQQESALVMAAAGDRERLVAVSGRYAQEMEPCGSSDLLGVGATDRRLELPHTPIGVMLHQSRFGCRVKLIVAGQRHADGVMRAVVSGDFAGTECLARPKGGILEAAATSAAVT